MGLKKPQPTKRSSVTGRYTIYPSGWQYAGSNGSAEWYYVDMTLVAQAINNYRAYAKEEQSRRVHDFQIRSPPRTKYNEPKNPRRPVRTIEATIPLVTPSDVVRAARYLHNKEGRLEDARLEAFEHGWNHGEQFLEVCVQAGFVRRTPTLPLLEEEFEPR